MTFSGYRFVEGLRGRRWALALYVAAAVAVVFPLGLLYKHLTAQWLWTEALGNALLVLAPYWLLRPRWRLTVLVPVWLTAFFVLSNFWYWRFFGDMMPVTSYLFASNVDSAVLGAFLELVKPKDAVLLALPLCITVLCMAMRNTIKAEPSFGAVTGWCAVPLSVAVFIGSYASASPNPQNVLANIADNVEHPNVMSYLEYESCGMPGYIVSGTLRHAKIALSDRKPTAADRAAVKDYYRLQSQITANVDTVPGSLPRNLIFIVVESLNSKCITTGISGNALMPMLQQLLERPGTLSALNMVSQTRSGVSSDGQFIYNTGMYPSSELTTAVFYADNSLTALPRVLPEHASFEAICESPAQWNHLATTLTYGYNQLYSNLGKNAPRGEDAAMFDTAMEKIQQLNRRGKPFLAFLSTHSMHTPFEDPAVETPQWISQAKQYTDEQRRYLSMTHYFDTQLGNFLDRLREAGLYDNSLIVIAADHNINVLGHGNEPIPFIALNAGITRRVEHPVGQVDVMPTVCQLMGVEDKIRGRAMGISMLNPELTGAIAPDGTIVGDSVSPRLQKLLRMSTPVANTLLRTNYFSKN